MPNWMTNLWNNEPGFPLRPLHQITLPGTHDTGCYVDHIYGNFQSRTQTQNVLQQLQGGIRYFDIRPYQANWAFGRSFWTYHGPFYSGGQVDGQNGILAQVNDFMTNTLTVNDRELVILNFSHFRSFGNADHVALINAITQTLGNHLVQRTQSAANAVNLFDATYTILLTDPANGNVRSRVAILYDGALDKPREAYVTANVDNLPAGFFTIAPKYAPAANPIYLFDQFADSGNLATMRTDQIDKLRQRQNYAQQFSNPAGNWPANAVGGVASTLHLFSWTLTPQPYTDPITAAANTSNPALLEPFLPSFGGWNGGGGAYDPARDFKINILYVDHYASQAYNNPNGSRFNGALPVAIAARLNTGLIWTWCW